VNKVKDQSPVIVIEPKSAFSFAEFKDVWSFRELFSTFAVRDIKVRYKQTVLGGLWAILQPLLTAVVFTFFFGKIAKMPSEGIPYAVFAYSGLVLWTFFSNGINTASNSTITQAHLISKIYFPRQILPISSTIIGLVDYGIAVLLIIPMMAYYRYPLRASCLLLPVIVFGTWILVCGIGFWLSAINVKYRDVRYVVPFFVQLLIFVTPVIYPVSIAGRYKWIVTLNPMTGFVEAHRALILGHRPVEVTLLVLSFGVSILLFATGWLYFRSVERLFADII